MIVIPLLRFVIFREDLGICWHVFCKYDTSDCLVTITHRGASLIIINDHIHVGVIVVPWNGCPLYSRCDLKCTHQVVVVVVVYQ